MKITVLASGSKGNSTLIEVGGKHILIDVGLPLGNLEKRLDREMPKIDILIITHTHVDHIKGIKSLLKKQKPIIFTLENDLDEKIDDVSLINHSKFYEEGDLFLQFFELSHDVPCMGVYLKFCDKDLVYMTDTGYVKEKILNKYKNKTMYIIESNYDEEMLMNGSYPFYLKQRIRSDKGHISNDDTCRYLRTLIGDRTRYVCLAHLSEENNNPSLALGKVNDLVSELVYSLDGTLICSQDVKEEILL